MIVITGATGALNGATLEHLLATMPASELGASVRDASRARSFAERGVRVREASYDDPAALERSFEGADQVLLVSSNDPGGDQVAQHRAGIRAAVAAGATRILYTSHQGAGVGSPFPPADSHARTEELLADSGVAWTSLRNGFYAHSLDWMLGPWRETGEIATPADGPTSWTHRADAAEGAAAILAGDRTVDGLATMTAEAAPTFEEIAGIASELTGREVRRVVLDDEEWVARQVAVGHDERQTRFLLGYFRAAREGRFAGTDPLLGELLGRPPLTVRDLLDDREGAEEG